ncbi:uncharacterized protein LOC128472699 isoform X2 [Spea bombifrons]|uniref:uncharacterized protein LOC128472699 isoform X2 n=1 Tax=Spea bombifrons TaxID=233779 RepID=UPI00234972DB|nr:uncharacterized protein LOC128472699 isoform X2 [Spea bombifrons]
MTCSVCTGAMGIDHFNWRIPFDHTAPQEFSNTDFLVTGVLPWMWQWWLEIGCGLILMVGFGQTLAYCTGSRSSSAHPLMFDNEEYYYS